MSRKKLSPVFPMSIDPDNPGVYLMKQASNSVKMWSKWDGRQWHTVAATRDTAERSNMRSMWAYDGTIVSWQGHAENNS